MDTPECLSIFMHPITIRPPQYLRFSQMLFLSTSFHPEFVATKVAGTLMLDLVCSILHYTKLTGYRCSFNVKFKYGYSHSFNAEITEGCYM